MKGKMMDQDDFLEARLDKKIDWYNKKSLMNQKYYKGLQIYQIIASVLIPVLIHYAYIGPLKIITSLIGASIAAVSAINGLLKLQENWLEYRTTCEALKHEKYLFLTGTEPYNIKDSFPLLVERVESLITKENTHWAQYMRQVLKTKEDHSEIISNDKKL